MTLEVQEKAPAHPAEEGPTLLPMRWDLIDKCHGIEVFGDGLDIRYNGSSKTSDDAAAIRSDQPIPKQCGIYYYEVTIISKNKEA